MGYTLELWAGSVKQIEEELRTPTLDDEALDVGLLPADARVRWHEDAAAVERAVVAGGALLDENHSIHVGHVIRLLAHHYGALAHSSSGGEEFRRRFLPGPAAQRFGFDAMAKLVNRPLAGLSWPAFPVIGWLDHSEVLTASESARAQPWVDPLEPDDAEPLWTLDRAIGRAADLKLDLLGVYW